MPLYLVNARDKPGSLPLRMECRPAHLEWAAQHADRIWMGGPVLSDDGEASIGSTFLVEFETLEAAKAWAAGDPYAQAGLFAAVEVVAYKWLLGEGRKDR